MALSERDRRVLNEIARQVQADDPELAAALTGRMSRPQGVWAPVGLRVLALILIAFGVLTSIPLLILAAFAVFGIAQLSLMPSSPRSSTITGGECGPGR